MRNILCRSDAEELIHAFITSTVWWVFLFQSPLFALYVHTPLHQSANNYYLLLISVSHPQHVCCPVFLLPSAWSQGVILSVFLQGLNLEYKVADFVIWHNINTTELNLAELFNPHPTDRYNIWGLQCKKQKIMKLKISSELYSIHFFIFSAFECCYWIY